ncbi:hypothetical protein ACWD04_10235 [Streptomyces sp. NPDC002911]
MAKKRWNINSLGAVQLDDCIHAIGIRRAPAGDHGERARHRGRRGCEPRPHHRVACAVRFDAAAVPEPAAAAAEGQALTLRCTPPPNLVGSAQQPPDLSTKAVLRDVLMEVC